MSSQSNKVPDAMPPSPRPPPAGFVEVANDPIPWKPGTVGDRLSGRFAGFGELQGRDGAFPVVRVRDDVGNVWAIGGRWAHNACERAGLRTGDDVVMEYGGTALTLDNVPYRRFRVYVRGGA